MTDNLPEISAEEFEQLVAETVIENWLSLLNVEDIELLATIRKLRIVEQFDETS